MWKQLLLFLCVLSFSLTTRAQPCADETVVQSESSDWLVCGNQWLSCPDELGIEYTNWRPGSYEKCVPNRAGCHQFFRGTAFYPNDLRKVCPLVRPVLYSYNKEWEAWNFANGTSQRLSYFAFDDASLELEFDVLADASRLKWFKGDDSSIKEVVPTVLRYTDNILNCEEYARLQRDDITVWCKPAYELHDFFDIDPQRVKPDTWVYKDELAGTPGCNCDPNNGLRWNGEWMEPFSGPSYEWPVHARVCRASTKGPGCFVYYDDDENLAGLEQRIVGGVRCGFPGIRQKPYGPDSCALQHINGDHCYESLTDAYSALKLDLGKCKWQGRGCRLGANDPSYVPEYNMGFSDLNLFGPGVATYADTAKLGLSLGISSIEPSTETIRVSKKCSQCAAAPCEINGDGGEYCATAPGVFLDNDYYYSEVKIQRPNCPFGEISNNCVTYSFKPGPLNKDNYCLMEVVNDGDGPSEEHRTICWNRPIAATNISESYVGIANKNRPSLFNTSTTPLFSGGPSPRARNFITLYRAFMHPAEIYQGLFGTVGLEVSLLQGDSEDIITLHDTDMHPLFIDYAKQQMRIDGYNATVYHSRAFPSANSELWLAKPEVNITYDGGNALLSGPLVYLDPSGDTWVLAPNPDEHNCSSALYVNDPEDDPYIFTKVSTVPEYGCYPCNICAPQLGQSISFYFPLAAHNWPGYTTTETTSKFNSLPGTLDLSLHCV